MARLRITHRIDEESGHDCDLMNLDGYSIREVVLPELREGRDRRVFEIEIHGRNLRSAGEPLFVTVGKQTVRWVRIAPDERSVSGILLEEPEEGSFVDVRLGDQDHARHPEPIDPGRFERIRE